MFENFGFFVIQVFVFDYRWKSKNRIYKSRRKSIHNIRGIRTSAVSIWPHYFDSSRKLKTETGYGVSAPWSTSHSSELSIALKIQHCFRFEIVIAESFWFATSAKYKKIKNLTPQYWIASAVLMLSPHSTDAIPPHVLMLYLHSTE